MKTLILVTLWKGLAVLEDTGKQVMGWMKQ